MAKLSKLVNSQILKSCPNLLYNLNSKYQGAKFAIY